MKLDIAMLDGDLTTVNNLVYQQQTVIDPGESPTIMFQLQNVENGVRYMPQAGATLQITLFSSNDKWTVNKVPTQSFAQDPSIWQFSLTPTESQHVAGVNMLVILTEGANVRKIWGKSVFVVKPNSPYKS